MVEIKPGLTQTITQLFAIGASILAIEKAKKKTAEIQQDNDALFAEYLKNKEIKNFEQLSKAILTDAHNDPKWKKEAGVPVGYQKAIKEYGSVGAAGYNSFRAYCAKWYTDDLKKRTPDQLKEEKEKKAAEKAEKVAAETPTTVTIGAVSTEALIEELRNRAEAGDPLAAKCKLPKPAAGAAD